MSSRMIFVLTEKGKPTGKSDTKIRLLAVYHILTKRGRATMQQIMDDLDLIYDIQCDRKAVYSDIRAIDRFRPIAFEGQEGGYAYSIQKGVIE